MCYKKVKIIKQALIFTDSYQLMTERSLGVAISSWTLVSWNTSETHKTLPRGHQANFIFGFYGIISPIHFSSLSSSFSCDFIPCSGCSALHREKMKNKKCFLSVLKLNKWVWDLKWISYYKVSWIKNGPIADLLNKHCWHFFFFTV